MGRVFARVVVVSVVSVRVRVIVCGRLVVVRWVVILLGLFVLNFFLGVLFCMVDLSNSIRVSPMDASAFVGAQRVVVDKLVPASEVLNAGGKVPGDVLMGSPVPLASVVERQDLARDLSAALQARAREVGGLEVTVANLEHDLRIARVQFGFYGFLFGVLSVLFLKRVL